MIIVYTRRIVIICIVIISICSLLTYFGASHRLVELTNHFRLQYWSGALIGITLMSIWRKWFWVVLAALVLIVNSIHLYPWTIKGGLQMNIPSGKPFTLVQANVQYNNTQYERMITYFKQTKADIITVQEINQEWADKLNTLKELYPYTHIEARPQGSGIALYSKFPLGKVETLPLISEQRPCIRAQIRVFYETINLVTFHPVTPISAAKFEGSIKETAAIAELMNQTSSPKILIGDFNDTMFSYRHSALLAKTGLDNVRSSIGNLGIPTWPSWLYFRWLMIPIDQCLVSDGIYVNEIRTGDANGSDHLPLEVRLEIPS